MSKNEIDIELIIAYISNDIEHSETRESVRYNIENDPQWFSAYLDLKKTALELESIGLDSASDKLLNLEDKKQDREQAIIDSIEPSMFDLGWLLKPQIAIGAACMLLIVIFASLPDNSINSTDGNTQFSTTRSIELSSNLESVGKIEIKKNILTISNSSNDELILFLNEQKFAIPIQGEHKTELDTRTNRIVVVNSFMDTVIDTTILIDE